MVFFPRPYSFIPGGIGIGILFFLLMALKSPSRFPPGRTFHPLKFGGMAALVAWFFVLSVSTARSETSELMNSEQIVVAVGQSYMLEIGSEIEAVHVAQPDIADVQLLTEQVAFVLGKSPGTTSLALVEADAGQKIQERIVHVVLSLDPVRKALEKEASLSQVSVQEFNRGAEIRGMVSSAAQVDRALEIIRSSLPDGVPMFNYLQVQGAQQVNLEVQIAEVQRGVSESLGFNWKIFAQRSGNLFGFAIGRLPAGPTTGLPPRQLFDGLPSTTAHARTGRGDNQLEGLVDALAGAGLASVLARPNLTAVSGETASFFSGGEYPLPSGYDDGQITFEFKKFGVLLDFVPTVVESNRIALRVRPEVSARSENQSITVFGINIPVIEVRRAETTIEVADGEPFVIAGMYRNQSDSNETGMPGFKDLPVAGALFGNRSLRADSTELLIVVTARLVGTPFPSPPPPTVGRTAGSQRTPGGFYF